METRLAPEVAGAKALAEATRAEMRRDLTYCESEMEQGKVCEKKPTVDRIHKTERVGEEEELMVLAPKTEATRDQKREEELEADARQKPIRDENVP